MKSARNKLILLGLICQGLTWDDYLLPLLYALTWVLCLSVPRKPVRLGTLGESLALVVGVVLGFTAGHALGYSNHFALGHGLAFMQLVRLMRPLDRREKVFSLLIAFFHLAVACTFLFDYRFLVVLVFAVALLPKAFAEVEAGSFLTESEAFPGPKSYARQSVRVTEILIISGIMVAFFLLFPRGLLGGGLRLPVTRPGDNATLLDTVLDPTTGASSNARRILFQIRGDQLGYLRCYTLTDFDGRRWTQGQDYRWRQIAPEVLGTNVAGVLHRQVRVKNPAFLGRVLPVDGTVVTLRGTFFRRTFETRLGMIETESMWTSPNNLYEYWIATNPPPQRLRRAETVQLTNYPAQSARLQTWLDQTLAGTTNSYQQARFLEKYFQRNFTYELGAPDLNRLNPTDDFIFNQRAGHCERFASAMGLLLRMKGIPTRVAIGYLPNSRNWISDWYDIRLRDAHSWTEGWFPDKGWVIFDATPAATLPPPSAWTDWFEAVDFAWYAHVVNFDAPTQNAMLNEGVQKMREAAQWTYANQQWIYLGALPFVAWLAWRYLRGRNWLKREAAGDTRQAQILAEHYYGKMLRALARKGFHRAPHQTPLEFREILHERLREVDQEIQVITNKFCATRYGGRIITTREQGEIETALKRIESL